MEGFFFPPADPRAHSPTNSGRRIYRIEKWRDAHTKKLGNERTAEQKSARDERKDEFCFDEPKKVDACAANAPPTVRGYSMCQQTLLGPELVVVSAHHKAKWTSNGRPHCFRTRGSWSFGNCCRNSAGLNAVEGFWGGRRPDHCGVESSVIISRLEINCESQSFWPTTSFFLPSGRQGRKSSCRRNRISR